MHDNFTAIEIREAIDRLGANLTTPRKRFADLYLCNGQNGTQAYLSVFNTKKPGCAAVGATRLMKRSDVRSYIEFCSRFNTDEVLNHLTVTKSRVLDEESKLAFIDVRKMFDLDGTFLPPKLWPEEIARAVAGLDVTQKWDTETNHWIYTYKIKLNDKGRALGRLETVLGMNKADALTDGDKSLFESFLTSIDGNTRGRLPSEMDADKE